MRIILNGDKMKTKDIAHEYIKYRFKFPDYYGENLDGLWDILSTYNDEIEIELIYKDSLIKYLNQYGEELIKVFQDVESENDKIRFTII